MSNEIESVLRVKRFEATVKAKKVVSLETIIRDFEGIAAALARQIAAEEQRTKVRDARRADYSMVALSAATRRAKLTVSLVDLKTALEAAKHALAAAAAEVADLESALGISKEPQHGTKRRSPPGRGSDEAPA
jgi:hypothetical protein